MTMDIYGHLMDTVNRQAATKLGRAVLGEQEDYGSKMVAKMKKGANHTSVNPLSLFGGGNRIRTGV